MKISRKVSKKKDKSFVDFGWPLGGFLLRLLIILLTYVMLTTTVMLTVIMLLILVFFCRSDSLIVRPSKIFLNAVHFLKKEQMTFGSTLP